MKLSVCSPFSSAARFPALRYRSLAALAGFLLVVSTFAGAGTSLATLSVVPRPVAAGIAAEAVVEAVTQATVAAQVAGRIVEVRVDAGQAVKRGQLLMRIDAREAAEAAQAAASRLSVARAEYERSTRLHAQNFISQAALDRARAEFDSAQAEAAQSGVGLGHATVTAPISGLVARRHAELGEMAAPGRSLLSLYDPAGLRVVAAVPQQRLAGVRAARVAVVEFPELGRRIEVSSFVVLPGADAATHVAQVRVNLPADEGAVPGMAARVTFVTGEVERLVVPARALVRRGELTAVYVVEPENPVPVLRRVRVGESFVGGALSGTLGTTGTTLAGGASAAPGDAADPMTNEALVEILAGLAAGERIALDPARAVIRRRSVR